MKLIMIVDDESISLMMTEHILSTEYQTVCAASGEEAFKRYHECHPDLVLSDLRMPGISGYELQQKLQEQFHEKIPFMFMTADPDEETESKGFENGAMDFIRKPFRADVLLRRVQNILQTTEQIKNLKDAATTDPMTGLLNKASAQSKIGFACGNTPGALLIIDLDSFKLVNDIYGHAMGDKILIRFAEIIKSAVRSTDLIGRIGGDEFIAYYKKAKSEDIIAQKTKYLNEQLVLSAKEYMGEDMNIPLGASIGCVFVPEEGTDFDTLFKKADEALYHVKKHGKHGYNIYQKEKLSKDEETKQTSGLAGTIRILSERSVRPGAFTLPLEQFRVVFQFLNRFTANYTKEVWVLFFTITSNTPDEPAFAETLENFLSVLNSSLRKSDVITQSSENQFMVLLLETSEANIDLILKRIMQNWADIGEPKKGHTLTYEKDVF